MKLHLSALLVMALSVGAAAAAEDELSRIVPECRKLLESVAQSDRAMDAARSAIGLAFRKARRSYTKVEARLGGPGPKAKPYDGPVLDDVRTGMEELLRGLADGERHLALAEGSLSNAKKLQSDIDVGLVKLGRSLAREALKAAEGLEAQRKRTKRRWDHLNSPLIANNPQAQRDARALVKVELSVATALWRTWQVADARLRFVKDRRRRLAQALLGIQRRLGEFKRIRRSLDRFRASLLNPLDNAPPKVSPEKLSWPGSLGPTMNVLVEDFKAPAPYKIPSHWRLKDRVLRFMKGGAP